MKLSSAPRNLFSGMMLALVAGLSVAPMAIALPTVNSSAPALLVLAQAASNVTATVLETDIRDDMVRVRLPNGSVRILLLTGSDIMSLGLRNESDVTLNMNGDRVVTMSRMVSVQARQPVSATIIELDSRDDTARVRLADGSTRNVLIAEQDITRLGLRRGSEVTLGIDNGLVVMMFMEDAAAPATEVQ